MTGGSFTESLLAMLLFSLISIYCIGAAWSHSQSLKYCVSLGSRHLMQSVSLCYHFKKWKRLDNDCCG